jgi:hypothetical protein
VRTTIATILLASGIATAQQPQPAPIPAEKQPPAAASKQPEQPPQPPSLDDLLGIKPEEKPKAGTKPGKAPPVPAEDPTKTALERKLTNKEVSEAFVQAVHLMDETAGRLESAKDVGITTQRMQEDVIRKLDVLISQAQKQKRQSKSKQKQQNDDPQQQQQQQQQSQSSQNNPSKSPAQDSQNPPGREGEQLGPDVAQGSAWGALRGRERDALMQGSADKYSLLYQEWTKAYYRKLAEEAGK